MSESRHDTLTVVTEPHGSTIHPHGDVTGACSRELLARLDAILGDPDARCAIDLSAVHRMDTTALKGLTAHHAAGSGGRIVLLRARPPLDRFLRTTQLQAMLTDAQRGIHGV